MHYEKTKSRSVNTWRSRSMASCSRQNGKRCSQSVSRRFTDKYKADRDMVCDYAGVNFDSWRDELLTVIKKLEKEGHYQGKTRGSVGQFISNMFVRHGDD